MATRESLPEVAVRGRLLWARTSWGLATHVLTALSMGLCDVDGCEAAPVALKRRHPSLVFLRVTVGDTQTKSGFEVDDGSTLLVSDRLRHG